MTRTMSKNVRGTLVVLAVLMVTVPLPLVAAQPAGWDAHAITRSADGARSVFATDMDGDGDVDVLSASAHDDTVAWHDNDGAGSFTTYQITTNAAHALSVYAADLDDDGDEDVLSASRDDDTVAWYENDGDGTFTEHVLTSAVDDPQTVFAADVDGDVDMDIVTAAASDDTVMWYENDGSGSFVFREVTKDADGPVDVFATDVDGDGDTDVLSANVADDEVAWYENEGAGLSFTSHTITTGADGVQSVYAADVDGDGDTDVLSASMWGDTVTWYENEGAGTFTEHRITKRADSARSVFGADVDHDGDVDVLSASYQDDTVAWYENEGSDSLAGDGTVTFTEHEITTTARHAHSVFAADVDGDEDVDVLAASGGDDTVAWHENLEDPPGAPQNLFAAPGSREGEVVLRWDPPADDGGAPVTEYMVYQSTSSGGPYEPVATVPASRTSYTDTRRELGEDYFYVTSAMNAAGEGDRSNVALAFGTAYDVDDDGVPDATEPLICDWVENPNFEEDGDCDGDDYHPPV